MSTERTEPHDHGRRLAQAFDRILAKPPKAPPQRPQPPRLEGDDVEEEDNT
jgi:hypothetical protein